MRRRLTIVIVATVIGAVAVVGLGTLALTRLDARRRNADQLDDRARALAAVVAEVRPARAALTARALQSSLGVDEIQVVPIARAPGWVGPAGKAELRTGQIVTDHQGDTAHAAVPLPTVVPGPHNRAVILTDSVGTGLGNAGRWFVVAAVATALAGVAVAAALARSLARPLAATEETAQRIAWGDLGARVPAPHPGGREDELDRLAVAINAMAASLQRSRQADQDFLLSVSHDLRTPLTSISGWAEALADGAAPVPAAAGENIRTAAQRLDRLVNDLLDLARLRTRAFTLALGPVDLRDSAAGAAEMLRPDLQDNGLAVTVDVPPEPVVVHGDPDRLAQIAANLLDNAGRHAAAAITVTVTGDARWAALAVEDDGPGIPVADRRRVFERLHSAGRAATRPGTGTGLGLAIVAELAVAMGGQAEATDAAGGGARLVVTLPRAGTRPGAGPGEGAR